MARCGGTARPDSPKAFLIRESKNPFRQAWLGKNGQAQEASGSLPGDRGVIFPKYEPVASHGDPIRVQSNFNLDHILGNCVFVIFGKYFDGVRSI